ncbi:MAG TPA: AMP-binding protein, partial [Flavobacterium sp.]|nr:AMP-binding protein [Flavobacterium sp.]
MSYYKIHDLENYFKMYKKSVREPRKFWDRIADENFTWYQKWDKVFEFDMQEAKFKWFLDAKVNITKNCIDRHLAKRGEKAAIIFEPNDPKEEAQTITYNELYARVSKMANVLREQGIKKGDRVCIYLPMIPELAVSVLACARIGAIHSVVFAGFSASAVATRINDSECKMVITSDGGFRGNKTIDLKGIIDEALEKCPSVEKVLVVKRTNEKVIMKEGRDLWLQPLLDEAIANNVAEIMDAEDPLFILYTSGSTGKPKGMLHTTAGYMVYTAYTFKNVFNYEENDIYWCT